jgi:hypothetical protein
VNAAGDGYTLTEASKTTTTFSIGKANGTSAATRSCSGTSAGCNGSSW